MDDITWFEVWWDYSSRPPALLVLTYHEQLQQFAVSDPGASALVVKQFASYEEAMFWLTEDEYTLIEGRVSPVED